MHLSAGELLRTERSTEGSEYGHMIEDHMRDGTIVPVAITCSLLEKVLFTLLHDILFTRSCLWQNEHRIAIYLMHLSFNVYTQPDQTT